MVHVICVHLFVKCIPVLLAIVFCSFSVFIQYLGDLWLLVRIKLPAIITESSPCMRLAVTSLASAEVSAQSSRRTLEVAIFCTMRLASARSVWICCACNPIHAQNNGHSFSSMSHFGIMRYPLFVGCQTNFPSMASSLLEFHAFVL